LRPKSKDKFKESLKELDWVSKEVVKLVLKSA
jgi:hypothetical protein